MKQLLYVLLLANISLFSQEGMWVPSLLEENEAQMQKQGFQLQAEDVYSVNNTSMKDAVVHFGGGCTGEVISNEGLVLTNHHCGFSAINAASSVENNYLKNGYWAYNKTEEIPAPGLTVSFIIRMEDVTDKIVPFLKDITDEKERAAKAEALSAPLIQAATEGTHYTASVTPYYYGNQYYLIVSETFTDIRLVGAPPASVGNFGGETDNWVWPRHTGDFSLFRIYANKENKPAAYSPENVPFTPRYYFPVSLKGIEENDFTMVFGFPGRTQEYLPSYAVDLLINTTNPNRITCRDARLEVMEKFMKGNDTVTLQYASKAKSLANAYKKWQGEKTGLEANDAIQKKQTYEKKFSEWTNSKAGEPYKNILSDFEKVYTDFTPYSELVDYTIEAFYGVEIISFARNYLDFGEKIQSGTATEAELKTDAQKLKETAAGFYKNYNSALDKKMFATMMQIFSSNVKQDLQPAYFKEQVEIYHQDFTSWANAVFTKSIFADEKKLEAYLINFSSKKSKTLLNDPVYKLCAGMRSHYSEIYSNHVSPALTKISELMRSYMQAQMEMQPNKKFYPDANSTLRVTFGNIKGYYPKDGVYYFYQTTDDGIERKYIAGDEEFDVPATLLKLFQENNFGRYADKNGNLPVGFIASNHTTGGNSGSPVLNAKGELIGINFDRVWEGTMSDVLYDINRCRNISVDIRYILFIIDKYANAQNILKELKTVE